VVTARSWVKVDRYVIFDLTREYRLTSPQFAVLLTLVMLADFRSHEWQGTIVELAEHGPPSRNTVDMATKQLANLGLITFVRPFRNNGHAVISVDCYDRVVVPNGGRGPSLPSRESTMPTNAFNRSPIAPSSMHIRAQIAQDHANEQEKWHTGRDRGEEEVGGGDVVPGLREAPVGPPCSVCGKPTKNAPFAENCQCPI